MEKRGGACIQLAGMITFMASAQILFKCAGLYAHTQSNWIHSLALNPWLWVGFCTSGIGMIFWLRTLRKLPLSGAYPWTALIYVITPIASTVFFNETLSTHYLSGMLLVVVGIFFSAGGSTSS